MRLQKTKNAGRNIVWGILAKAVLLLMPFLIRSIVIYKLGSQYVGLGGLFTSILSVLSLAELGFAEATTFHMYKPLANGDDETNCAILNLLRKIYFVVGIIVVVGGLAVMPFLRYFIHGDVPADINLYVLFAVFLVNTAASYFGLSYRQTVLIVNQRNDIMSKISSAINMAVYVIQIIILLTVANYYVYAAFIPVATIGISVAQYVAAKKKYPNLYPHGVLPKSEVREIRKTVFGVLFHKIGGVVSNSADTIVVSAVLGLTLLAIYSNYMYVVTVISGFYVILTDAILGGVGNALEVESKEKNYNDMLKFSFMGCWILGWATVCMAVLYQPFMMLWVGPDLMFSPIIMMCFCIYFFFMRFDAVSATYKSAAGIWAEDKWRPIVSGAVNIGLNIGLALSLKQFGDQYAVLGTVLSSVFCKIVIDYPWAHKVFFDRTFEYGMKKHTVLLAFYSIATALISFGMYYACSFIPMERNWLGFAWIVLRGVICIIVPNLFFWLFYFKLPVYASAKEFVGIHLHRVFRRK